MTNSVVTMLSSEHHHLHYQRQRSRAERNLIHETNNSACTMQPRGALVQRNHTRYSATPQQINDIHSILTGMSHGGPIQQAAKGIQIIVSTTMPTLARPHPFCCSCLLRLKSSIIMRTIYSLYSHLHVLSCSLPLTHPITLGPHDFHPSQAFHEQLTMHVPVFASSGY